MLVRLADLSFDALSFAPLLLALIIAALASPFLLGSWNFSAKAIAPDLTRLDPLKGLARLVSWSGLVELVKAVAKARCWSAASRCGCCGASAAKIFALFGQSVEAGLASAGHLVSYSFLMIVMTMLLIVAIDVPFQLWQYYDKLKMSKEEVKQERQGDGRQSRGQGADPPVAARGGTQAHDGAPYRPPT